jgi:choline dehydrogenase-like flavoprotein
MSDARIETTITGGHLQGVTGAGSVVIENFNIYNRAVEDAPVTDVAADPIGPCPYPGLSYFGPGDADLFFGRDAAITRLAEAVGLRSLTALVGASGSGKSSVVLAGLAPYLYRVGGWRFSHFRIGTEVESNPFLALSRAMVPLYVASDSDTERLRNVRLLATSLETGELTLRDVFADCRSRNKGTRILLIADQFEEAFTRVKDEAVLRRFIDVLLDGFHDPAPGAGSDISLIVTLRADFYGHALRYRPLADALQEHVENLGPMNRRELHKAIRCPADKAQVSFDPGLVETLLDEVESRPGSLPLLQFALREMWGRQEERRITRKTYDDIGSVRGALAQRAEQIFAAMTNDGENSQMEQVFRRLFTRLVAFGEGQEDTRRAVGRGELSEDAWSLAQRLAGENNRLIVVNAHAGRETAEVAHEALIRHWPRLIGWVDSDRAFQTWLRQIRPNVELWSADPNDEAPLLRGSILARTIHWFNEHADDFNRSELSFIRASIALRERMASELESARQVEVIRLANLDSLCNMFDEAQAAADLHPFDLIVIGGGSFGPVFLQNFWERDRTRARRILVLEAGHFVLQEHAQNLGLLGLKVPPPTPVDPGIMRNGIWGLPWHTDVPGGFPGLAYCVGGRSLFSGGWSPRPLASELAAAWPVATINDLVGPVAGSVTGYLAQAAEQMGADLINDSIFGPLHEALRAELKQAIDAGRVTDAIPLDQLPLTLSGIPHALANVFKLEAPLAVQASPPRGGIFPFNKFSSAPLIIETARAAQFESNRDKTQKRLMVVPDCHVTRLITDGSGPSRRVVAVETSGGTVPVSEEAVVILAVGTIENARLAALSLPGLPDGQRIGANLMVHLRSNLTIRLSRASVPVDPAINELQASALFVKGRHDHADHRFGHFHLQITAAGLGTPDADGEAELFKKIPDIDTTDNFLAATDKVVITIRGVGEMRPNNPASHVTLSSASDEFHQPRAFVSIDPTADDIELWDAMDKAAEDVALALANGLPYEVLTGHGFQPVSAGASALTVLPRPDRRDGLGATHHEAGTLAMGDDPANSVTNADARFHCVPNLYAVGPALFPSVGSYNPMLTGTALARRLAHHLTNSFVAELGFTSLFDGASLAGWRISKIRNGAGQHDRGLFVVTNGALVAMPGADIGLLWHEQPTPPDFVLKLEWRRWQEDASSGIFLRFPNPESRNYDNTAYVGVDFGFEVQIDQLAAPDGLPIHKTAAIYGFRGPDDPDNLPVFPIGEWNSFEIRAQGQSYSVFLNGIQVTVFDFVPGSDLAHPDRGMPHSDAVPRYVGLQSHTGRVAFRRIQIRPL